MKRNPFPTVEYGGRIYKLRSRKAVIPDFSKMTVIQSLVWLNRNTWPRGYSKPDNPLAGMGGAISISSKEAGA